jgi:hypothetical protein
MLSDALQRADVRPTREENEELRQLIRSEAESKKKQQQSTDIEQAESWF